MWGTTSMTVADACMFRGYAVYEHANSFIKFVERIIRFIFIII